MTKQILVVDDEPDLEALIQQKFRHQIRSGPSAFCSLATVSKPWLCCEPTAMSTWWLPTWRPPTLMVSGRTLYRAKDDLGVIVKKNGPKMVLEPSRRRPSYGAVTKRVL